MSERGFGWRALLVGMALVVVVSVLGGCATTPGADDDDFVFGVVLVGPYNDHGWSEAHYVGAQYAEERVDSARMIYLDKLNPADRPNTTLEQVVDDMVNDGAQFIMTTSDDFAVDTDIVAAKYPDIPFLHISGDRALTGEAPPNVSNYMGQMIYGKAVAGCAAALKTETGTIGYVGPLINSETRRLTAATYLGAQYCYENYRGRDPRDLRFVVTWIGFWFNIPGVTLDPTDVSNDLFNAGADVLVSGIDTTEALVVTGQRADRGEQVWAVPYDYEEACSVKPEVCLGVPYYNWGPAYVGYIEAARAGEWEQSWVWDPPYWDDINDHDRSPIGYLYGDAVTAEEQAILEEYIQGLADQSVNFFVGPLNFQDGSVFLQAGERATLEQIWSLPQLLEGMEGASN